METTRQPFLYRQLRTTNEMLLGCLPGCVHGTLGPPPAYLWQDEAEGRGEHYLSLVVDSFGEELDMIRQTEEISPNKLELLIDSLKTGSMLHAH